MRPKIVFFDIDGTIYRPHIGVTDKTKFAINALTANGIYAYIATGRAFSMVTDFLNLGFSGVNAGCGTYITCNNKVILNKEITGDLQKETLEVFEKNEIDAILEGEKMSYYNGNIDTVFIEGCKKNNCYVIKPWQEGNVAFNKMSIQIKNREAFYKILPFLRMNYDIIDRRSDYIEVLPKGYNKASGIKFLMEYLDIPWENTYAFGDSANDIDMLKYVKNSVAMGNAEDEVKNISKYTTETLEKDGVYNGLKVLGLI